MRRVAAAVLLLLGCLPTPAPFRCGPTRACDGVQGSMCVEGYCAEPVPDAVCASGLRYSASAAEPGRCAPPTSRDAATDLPLPDDRPDAAAPDDRPDVPATDLGLPDAHIPSDIPSDISTDISSDISSDISTDVPTDARADAPTDAPADIPADIPPDPTVPPSPVAQVVAGAFHTCALLDDRSVYCWGSNEFGQVGAVTGELYRPNPVRVFVEPVAALAAGAFHTCARAVSGALYCWGRNDEGQLGVGDTNVRATPQRVNVPGAVGAMAAGASHTCALGGGGDAVYCWGSNRRGAVGGSAAGLVLTPSQVAGITARSLVAGEGFTCAADPSRAWCWGRNGHGELSIHPDRLEQSAAPQRVTLPTPEAVQELYAGGFTACARTTTRAFCWGRGDLGAIPTVTAAAQSEPVEVELYASTTPTLGYIGQCATDSLGALRCWGANELGDVGNGTNDRLVASPITPTLRRVRRVAGRPVVAKGYAHTCAAEIDGALRCWGARYFGHLGDGRTALLPTPVEVPALRGAATLSAGRAYTCGVFGTGAVTQTRCVGINTVAQLGGSRVTSGVAPAVETRPVTVPTGNLGGAPFGLARRVVAGSGHTCAETASGSVACWGSNAFGQFGGGGAAGTVHFGAVSTTAFGVAQSLDVGVGHTCAISNGLVRCAGANHSGQCGVTTSVPFLTMATVVPGVGAPTQATALATGDDFTCALLASGAATCWGASRYGQCLTESANPVLPGLTVRTVSADALGITAGSAHACAWSADAVWCWGRNNRGQLGRALATSQSGVPVAVAGLARVSTVVAGDEFTCAIASNRAWCWGSNTRGQLGDGTFTDRSAVAEVLLPGAPLSLVAGAEHACAGLADGRVYCWGSNHLAQLAREDELWERLAESATVRWTR